MQEDQPTTRPMTQSPRQLAREALEVARQALPAYACSTSRHNFTQAQRCAIQVLKAFLTTDSRGGASPFGAVACHTTSHLIAAAVAVGLTHASPFFDDRVGAAGQHALGDRLLADAAYDAAAPAARGSRRATAGRWSAASARGRRAAGTGGLTGSAGRPRACSAATSGYSARRSRSEESRERECLLRVLTHNRMLLAAAEN
ncbi:MAG TPA: hypothetical protein VNK04_06415 [Gemmataceae bacterium]|nr:hypothetical protein [Gemmataceae bacterium]